MALQKKLIPPPRPVPFIDHRKNKQCTIEFQVYDRREADGYITYLEKLAGIKRSDKNG